jgi:hydroxymethylglutaryl-CoA reductase
VNGEKSFHKLALSERQTLLAAEGGLTSAELAALTGQAGLNASLADHMIENAVGVFGLPLGIARHFVVNGRKMNVPMAIEEPSVVAGVSYMAKLVAAAGGFTASAGEPIMIGQMQVLDCPDLEVAKAKLLSRKEGLLKAAGEIDPVLQKLGGGPRGIEVHIVEDSPIGAFLVLHLLYDVRDAMGANAVNTAVERLAPQVEEISGGRVLLRILSNLADRRLARAECTVRLKELASNEQGGEQARDGIIAAWAFAAADPHRATTHNKGIMNGIDAVAIATGNDWRAIEAGAHAWAARSGRYTSLSVWEKDPAGNLHGLLEMPMAVGIVGGATRVHPGAQAALKLMGVGSAGELAGIIVSVGLAQNLAALRALATEGIQRGHMRLHARQVAMAAGANGEDVEKLAEQLVKEENVRIDRAIEILNERKSL